MHHIDCFLLDKEKKNWSFDSWRVSCAYSLNFVYILFLICLLGSFYEVHFFFAGTEEIFKKLTCWGMRIVFLFTYRWRVSTYNLLDHVIFLKYSRLCDNFMWCIFICEFLFILFINLSYSCMHEICWKCIDLHAFDSLFVS